MFAFCLAIALQTPSLPAEEQTAVVQFEKQFGKGLLRVDREGRVRGVCFGFHKSINEADLDILARFEELEAIDCGVSGVTGEFLQYLKASKKLKSMHLWNAQKFQEKHLVHLRGIPSLEYVNLGDCFTISDVAVAHVVELPKLKQLDLSCSKVTNNGAKLLGSMQSLEWLNLSATYVDDSGLEFIAKCGKLKTLWLQFNSQITNTGLKKLSHIANNLEELVLGSTHITDDGVDDLARMSALRSLHLNCLPISNMGLKQLSSLKSLRKLSVQETNITNDGLACLSNLENLEELELRRTKITDESVQHLTRIKGLKFLDVTNTGISNVGRERLMKQFPKLDLLF